MIYFEGKRNFRGLFEVAYVIYLLILLGAMLRLLRANKKAIFCMLIKQRAEFQSRNSTLCFYFLNSDTIALVLYRRIILFFPYQHIKIIQHHNNHQTKAYPKAQKASFLFIIICTPIFQSHQPILLHCRVGFLLIYFLKSSLKTYKIILKSMVINQNKICYFAIPNYLFVTIQFCYLFMTLTFIQYLSSIGLTNNSLLFKTFFPSLIYLCIPVMVIQPRVETWHATSLRSDIDY